VEFFPTERMMFRVLLKKKHSL